MKRQIKFNAKYPEDLPEFYVSGFSVGRVGKYHFVLECYTDMPQKGISEQSSDALEKKGGKPSPTRDIIELDRHIKARIIIPVPTAPELLTALNALLGLIDKGEKQKGNKGDQFYL